MKRIILFLILALFFISACSVEELPPKRNDCGVCPLIMPSAPDFCEGGLIVPGETDDCGCEGTPRCQKDDTSFEETEGNYYVKYENGIIEYKITIEKPTPCYDVSSDEMIMESYPVQVVVDISLEEPPTDIACIQVIEEEVIEGTMNIGHKPGSFAINLDGEIVYSTNLKNE